MDGEAIAKTRAEFVAALLSGDAAAASAVYADDAQLLAPSAELIAGREGIAAFWRAGLDAGIAGVELEELTLDGGESVAWEIGSYALRLDPAEGGPVVDRGKYVLVHERQEDGSWRRAVEMFNPDAPPATLGGARKEDGCSR
jgi:ketosteroid isomerase-like protein